MAQRQRWWVGEQRRGEWGWEGVEPPDRLVQETVFEPAGVDLEALQSCRPRQQQANEAVRWVVGVTCNPGGFARLGVVNIQ